MPVVTIPQTSYTADHGMYVILECTIAANPVYTHVQWYKIKNGNYVNLNVTINSKYSGSTVGNPSLTISSLLDDDEGYYICSATNDIGSSQSSPTLLNVHGGMLNIECDFQCVI